MSSATFLVSVNGDGSTVTDDANPNTGLANGGHRERLVPAFAQIVNIAEFVVEKALEAQASAAAAAGGATTNSTSSSTATLPAVGGTLTLSNIASSSTYQVGMKVAAVSTATPTTKGAYGTVSAWTPGAGPNTGTLSLVAEEVVGSGSVSGWSISLSQFGVPKARTVATTGLATGGGDLSANRTINVPATAATDVNGGTDATKAMTSAAFWGAQQEVAVPYSGSMTLDLAAGSNFYTTITGAPAIGTPTNMKVGQSITWELTNGVGAGVPSFTSAWKRKNASAASFSTVVGQKNIIKGKVMRGGYIEYDVSKNVGP
jgi:hypothetical protein